MGSIGKLQVSTLAFVLVPDFVYFLRGFLDTKAKTRGEIKVEYLIPKEWFLGLAQWQLLVLVAIAIAALGKASDVVVEGASGIASGLGISKIVIGATIVSLGTTSPECAVSVLAAWSGEPGLALGNAVGSIIVDSGLIFGFGCLLTVLPADRFVLSRQGWTQFGSGVFLALLCYGFYLQAGDRAELGRSVGLIMLVALAGYMILSVRWSRSHPGSVDSGSAGSGERLPENASSIGRLAIPVTVGLIFVLLTSRVLICAVIELADNHWNIPKVVIAATLIAFGTSLPELVIGMASIRRGHAELLVGNIVGADILNVLFVVGAAATAAPLPIVERSAQIPEIMLYIHLPTMLLILTIFRLYIYSASSRGSFRRWYGVPLLAIYVSYVALQLSLKP